MATSRKWNSYMIKSWKGQVFRKHQINLFLSLNTGWDILPEWKNCGNLAVRKMKKSPKIEGIITLYHLKTLRKSILEICTMPTRRIKRLACRPTWLQERNTRCPKLTLSKVWIQLKYRFYRATSLALSRLRLSKRS